MYSCFTEHKYGKIVYSELAYFIYRLTSGNRHYFDVALRYLQDRYSLLTRRQLEEAIQAIEEGERVCLHLN